MKINSKNNNVLDFKLFDSNCLIKTLDNKIYVNDNFISDDVSSFLGVGNIIYFTKNKILHSFDIISNNLKIEIFPIPSLDIQNDKYLNLSDFEIIPNNYACNYYINEYSFPFGQLISKTKNKYTIGYGVWIDPVFYFCNSEIEITSLHLPTETTLWQFSVADLGASKVSKIMGVFGQVLLVVAETVWPEHIFVGLDVATGAVLCQVKCNHYLMPTNAHYYAPNNSLLCLVDDNLWEYSLTEQRIIRDKHFPEAFTKGEVRIKARLGSLVGDLFYFAGEDMNKPITSAFVGVFDIVKEKLIDIIDLKSNGKFSLGGNSRPKVANNKIYTLDTANTLHILELEEGELNV
jgi:hypothetical protein